MLLLTNLIEKRGLVPLGMKVSNNIKKIIGRPDALRHVMHVILEGGNHGDAHARRLSLQNKSLRHRSHLGKVFIFAG